MFKDITDKRDDDWVKELFVVTREAVSLASPFVGLPNTMPANFGIIAILKGRGIEKVESKSRCVVTVTT